MEKPLNLIIEEGKESIIKAVNSSGLPAYLLEPIIKDIYNEIVVLKNKELEESKRKIKENEEEEKVNDKNTVQK